MGKFLQGSGGAGGVGFGEQGPCTTKGRKKAGASIPAGDSAWLRRCHGSRREPEGFFCSQNI